VRHREVHRVANLAGLRGPRRLGDGEAERRGERLVRGKRGGVRVRGGGRGGRRGDVSRAAGGVVVGVFRPAAGGRIGLDAITLDRSLARGREPLRLEVRRVRVRRGEGRALEAGDVAEIEIETIGIVAARSGGGGGGGGGGAEGTAAAAGEGGVDDLGREVAELFGGGGGSSARAQGREKRRRRGSEERLESPEKN
jgi:hypothetical protein